MSELSRWDRFKLEAAIASQYHEAYNCNKCLKVNPDPQASKIFRTSRGCLNKVKNPTVITEDGTKVFMCLGRMYTHKEVRVIEDYRIFLRYNSLPEEGGVGKQSSRLIESFLFIESEIAKNEEQLRKKKDGERNSSRADYQNGKGRSPNRSI